MKSVIFEIGIEWLFIALLVTAIITMWRVVNNYREHMKIRKAEWLSSLFEKFHEDPCVKEVRGWLDHNCLHERLENGDEEIRRQNEQKLMTFLNYFNFISVLYSEKFLTAEQIYDLFDHYLRTIKGNSDCQHWISQDQFGKVKMLLGTLYNDII